MKRKYKQLTSPQRYTISKLLQQGSSLRFIAKVIGVSASTVSREVQRNRLDGSYKPKKAEALMHERQSYRKYPRVFTKSMIQHIGYNSKNDASNYTPSQPTMGASSVISPT